MPRRTKNLDTLLMALELLKRIPRSRKVSAPELMVQLREAGFDRDLRTIQRQLDELSQHFDIDRDERSKPYGYSWKSNSKGLSLPGLNEQESLLLSLAEQQLKHLLPASLMKSMASFFTQARSQLHVDGTGNARDWARKVRVVSTRQRLLPPQMAAGVFEAVSNALYANHWLNVSYVNAAGKVSDSRVMPLGLAQQGERLLLVCRFEGFDDERSLALNRMRQAADTGQRFTRPPGFDLEAFDDGGGFGFGHGKKIKLVFRLPRLTGVHLVESPLSQDQTYRQIGDVYEFSATVVESEQLKWWLRGFGAELELRRPASLLR